MQPLLVTNSGQYPPERDLWCNIIWKFHLLESTSWYLGPVREEWLFRGHERSDPSPGVPHNHNRLPPVKWNPPVTYFLYAYTSITRASFCINLPEEVHVRHVHHQLVLLTTITIWTVHSQEITQITNMELKWNYFYQRSKQKSKRNWF